MRGLLRLVTLVCLVLVAIWVAQNVDFGRLRLRAGSELRGAVKQAEKARRRCPTSNVAAIGGGAEANGPRRATARRAGGADRRGGARRTRARRPPSRRSWPSTRPCRRST